MARGESGRIVLEIDPVEKKELYDALTKDGLTLKDWFLKHAGNYLRERGQGQLFDAMALSEAAVPYRVGPAGTAVAKKKGGKRKSRGKGE
jgi:hypothetical protein